jgi:hypothetical protein
VQLVGVGGGEAAPVEPFSAAALAGFAGQRRSKNMHSSVRDLILRSVHESETVDKTFSLR